MNKKVFKTLEEAKKFATFNGKYWNIAKIEDPNFISGAYKDYFWFEFIKNVTGIGYTEDWKLANSGIKIPFTIPEQTQVDSSGKVIATIPARVIDLSPRYNKVQKEINVSTTAKSMELPRVFYIIIENITGIATPKYDLEKVKNLFHLPLSLVPAEKQEFWVKENRDKILKECQDGTSHFNPTKGEIKLARISSKNAITRTESTFTFTIGDIANDLLQISNLIKK